MGDQPLITALDPFTATVLGPSFTMTVEGAGFITGTTALWDGHALTTTYIDSTHLAVQVGAAQLDHAKIVTVTARSSDSFVSNGVPFVVEALLPSITSLSPDSKMAESPTFVLTINGKHFAPDAQVVWNDTPLLTHFVNGQKVTAQIDANLLALGQTVGVAVRNPTPDATTSPILPFTVQPFSEQPIQKIYLPAVMQ